MAEDLGRRKLTDPFDVHKIEELRELSEPELIQRYDEVVDHANRITTMGAKTPFLSYAETYMSELFRRETVRQGERMEALTRSLNRFTRWLVWLTVLIAISTIVSVGITAVALYAGA